jgi:IclR family pca regulon transcriptional regulator
MGAHVDRVSAGELIDRFLPLLRRGAEDVRSQLL